MSNSKKLLVITAIIIAAAVLVSFHALADTDGSEIQITDQPDRLILQLGPQWAGVEFELKTDAGIFPVPIVVNAAGILKMDLGGSKTYTLSCLTSATTLPIPKQHEEASPTPMPGNTPDTIIATPTPDLPKESVPAGILVTFIIGLLVAAGGLIVMRYCKRRREDYYYDDYD